MIKYAKTIFEVLAESKKARALVVGLLALALAPVAVKLGANEVLLEEYLDKGLLMLGAYILGQGLADVGKKAKTE